MHFERWRVGFIAHVCIIKYELSKSLSPLILFRYLLWHRGTLQFLYSLLRTYLPSL